VLFVVRRRVCHESVHNIVVCVGDRAVRVLGRDKTTCSIFKAAIFG